MLEGVIAAVLLAAGAASGADALSALQTAAIVAGLPLGIVLIMMAVGLSTALRDEKFVVALPPEPSPLDSLRHSTTRVAPGEDGRPAAQQAESDPLMRETAVAEFATSPSNGVDDPGRTPGPGDDRN